MRPAMSGGTNANERQGARLAVVDEYRPSLQGALLAGDYSPAWTGAGCRSGADVQFGRHGGPRSNVGTYRVTLVGRQLPFSGATRELRCFM